MQCWIVSETENSGVTNIEAEKIAKALLVANEICQGDALSDDIVLIYLRVLRRYTYAQVDSALSRCAAEVSCYSGKHLALSEICKRIEDGRPSPDEAWSIVPTSEEQTVVWTDEIASAWGQVREMDDRVAARKSFLDIYDRLVSEARLRMDPTRWTVSCGTDPARRELAINNAITLGRLPASTVRFKALSTADKPSVHRMSTERLRSAVSLLSAHGIEVPQHIVKEIEDGMD